MHYADMDVAESPLELIGNTPMVRLGKIGDGLTCDLVAKLETTNPGGSSKDRPALTMVEAAERDGLLGPGSTIIEPTSGNTGVGLAIVAAQRGYQCVFVMSDKMAPEKIDLLRAYGAQVVVCPTAVAPDHPDSYYSTAERLTKETPNAFRPDQYSNPNNPRAHYETTGPEIWSQTKGRVTHFVAGAGTGGTISGVGRFLKEQNPEVKVLAIEPPAGELVDGLRNLDDGYIPPVFLDNHGAELLDGKRIVRPRESIEWTRRLTEVGIFAGISSGAILAGAVKTAATLESGTIVTVCCDAGWKYLSTGAWTDDIDVVEARAKQITYF